MAETTRGPSALNLTPNRAINELITGDLVLHYDTRTVVLRGMSGDAALRILAVCDERLGDERERWADPIDPETSSALLGWLTLQTGDRLLTAEWRPLDVKLPKPAPATAADTRNDRPPAADQPDDLSTVEADPDEPADGQDGTDEETDEQPY